MLFYMFGLFVLFHVLCVSLSFYVGTYVRVESNIECVLFSFLSCAISVFIFVCSKLKKKTEFLLFACPFCLVVWRNKIRIVLFLFFVAVLLTAQLNIVCEYLDFYSWWFVALFECMNLFRIHMKHAFHIYILCNLNNSYENFFDFRCFFSVVMHFHLYVDLCFCIALDFKLVPFAGFFHSTYGLCHKTQYVFQHIPDD